MKPAAGTLACIAVLLLLGLAVYLPVIGYGYVSYDDSAYASGNPVVRRGLHPGGVSWAFTSTHANNWHPLTWLSLMSDVSVFGPGPQGHHLVNVLLHLLNVVLVFAVLRGMTGSLWGSFMAAGVFGLHPLRVESVAWISERKDVLGGFFWLLGMAAWLRYARRPGPGRYAPVVLLMALGLMSKPVLVTFPLALLLLDMWPLGRLGGWRPVAEKLPLLALSAASGAVTFLVQKGTGAMVPLEHYPFVARLANIPISYWRYVGKVFWPAGLTVHYPYRVGLAALAWGAAAAALLGAVSWLAARLARTRPWLPAGWFWYLGTMLPMIGLVQVGPQAIADRYTYIPALGLGVAVIWTAAGPAGRRARPARWAAGAAFLAGLAVLGGLQARHWRDDLALFGHAVEVDPRNPVALCGLGEALLARGDTRGAAARFEECLRLNPRLVQARNNLGVALAREGRLEEALGQFSETLRLDPAQGDAYSNMGVALLGLGRRAEAAAAFREALRLGPRSPLANYNMGRYLAESGERSEAEKHLRAALEADPDHAEARGLLEALTRGR